MSAESIAKALTDHPDEPKEAIEIAAAAWTSGEDDALSLVYHLTGRGPADIRSARWFCDGPESAWGRLSCSPAAFSDELSPGGKRLNCLL